MAATLGSFLVTLLVGLLKAWLDQKSAASAQQQLGALKAEQNANNVAVQAEQARNNVKPITAEQLPEHNPSNDPDFRD